MDRPVYFLELPSFEQWPDRVELGTAPFVLFIASDASIAGDEQILSLVRPALKAGVIEACVWGPECQRVHDLFDSEIAGEALESRRETKVLATTWHEGEPLEEALDYFLHSAGSSEDDRDPTIIWLAVSVGSHAYAERIETWFHSLPTDFEK